MHTPRLSVIIVCTGDTVSQSVDCAGLDATLAALHAQVDPPDMEIVVPYHARMKRIGEVQRHFPRVRFLDAGERVMPAGRGREHHDQLRAHGVAMANGDVVAFLEDHVRPDPHWSARLMEAHQQPYAGVGGTIDNAVDRPLSWAAYFVDLGRYQSPLPAGTSPVASLVNASYKRSALEQIRPVWCDRFNETKVNAAIVASGGQLVLDPRPVVYQHRMRLQLRMVLVEFLVWGRSYAAARIARMPPAFRILYAFMAPLLVVVLWLRQASIVFGRGSHRAAFVRAAPFSVLLTLSWAYGEWLGCVTGRAYGRTAFPVRRSIRSSRTLAAATDGQREREPLAISVVIAWVNPLELLRPGLDALARQRIPPDEVIVVTRHSERLQARLRSLHPEVLVVGACPVTPIPRLRAIGIRRTRGDAVAITEDHCIPDGEWTASLAQSLRAGCSVVGGPVENACRTRLRDWAAFLTEYASLLPSADEQPGVKLGGNNVAYRRGLLGGLCEVLEHGRWESFYHDTLAARGVELAFNPHMMVYHRRPFGIRYFLQQRYHYSRSFAAMRRDSFSRATRVRYAVGTCLLPPLLVVRGLLVLAHKRRYLALYLCCLPLVAVYVSVGALGEMVGYVLGGGDSLARVE